MAGERADYAKAARRLAETYSLERVARERIEVRWDDLLGMATPLSYRVPVQACHHPNLVFVQPDLSIALGPAPDALGFGFAVGVPAQLADIWQVTRRLRKDYQPIVESQWSTGPITLGQTAFTVLPNDPATVTGREPQYVVVRMSVRNRETAPRDTPLYLIIGRMGGSQNAAYRPFLAPVSRWQTPPLGITADGASLVMNGRTLLTYRCDASITAIFHAALDNPLHGRGEQNKFNNCLKFDLRLGPGETRVVDFVMSSSSKLSPLDDRRAMQRVEFDAALRRTSAHWDQQLAPAMEYTTPEPRLNQIYKQLILSSLGHLLQTPDRHWHEPLQTPIAGVWAWEFAHMAIPMMAVGYCRPLEPSLRYFTERQNGVGPQSANAGPVGDVKTTRGSYVGSTLLWMNETGSILWAIASHYRYAHDATWLKANRPSVLAAWDWIQRERARTRLTDSYGEKVPHYGLLPSGRPGDQEGKWYQFTFNDNFTWLGMSEIAAAFHQAGLPEAQRLTQDAEEYRQRILDVIRQQQYVNPETHLLFIPNSVGYRLGGPRDPYWQADGPIQLFDTGLLSPRDERFAPW